MCHDITRSGDFYRLLFSIDQGLASDARAAGCPCGGALHRANYPRKPRGLDSAIRSICSFRLSFCCAVCRRRTTPESVRFFGRRVYVAAILILVSATRASAGTAAAARLLDGCVPVATIRRWRRWWREDFPSLPFWRLGRAEFAPPVDVALAPASLLERFTEPRLERTLRWLSPLTKPDTMVRQRAGR